MMDLVLLLLMVVQMKQHSTIEAANTDDRSCVAVVNGCTDETAFNYSDS